MTDSVGLALFGGCVCILGALLFISRKMLATIAVKVAPTQDRERHYRMQQKTLTAGSSLVFLAGLVFTVWGLIGYFSA